MVNTKTKKIKDNMDKETRVPKDRMDRDNKATMEGLDTSLVTKDSLVKNRKVKNFDQS